MHSRDPVRAWKLNAEVERFFQRMKRWCRISIVPPHLAAIQ